MIDIEKIKQDALDAVDELDDCARMETSIYAIGAVSHLTHFINTVCERLKAAEREISAQNKQLAAKDEWIAAAISKLEAAEKDAARYQWMRDNHDTASTLDGNIAFTVEIETNVTWTAYTFHDAPMLSFDDAVDAAIKESE